jgi:DNA-binding beta-propeller fold protein YncE
MLDKKGRIVFWFIAAIGIIEFSGCRKDKAYPAEIRGYPYEIGKIFITKCATSGCHDDKSYAAAGNLNLSSWKDLFAGTAAGLPVVPYSSKFSYLMYFINTYSDLGPVQQPLMPLNGTPLSRSEVLAIKKWIDEGAPDAYGNVYGSQVSDKLFVVNQGCDVVTVVDASNLKPIRFIPVGTLEGITESPHAVRVSPDGKYFYVIFINNNIMQKFRTDNYQWIANIPLSPLAAGSGSTDMKDWNSFIISSDGKRAYVAAWTALGAVSAVDLEKHKLLHFLPGLVEPHGICLNKTEDSIIVSAQKGNYISIIDTAFQYKYDISVQPGFPPSDNNQINIHEALLSPVNPDEVWMTCQNSDDIRIFNLVTHTLQIIPAGDNPQTLCWSKTNGKCFVSAPYDVTTFPGKEGVITVIDATTKQTQQFSMIPQCHGIYFSDKYQKLYVLSRNIGGTIPPHHTNICNGKNGFITERTFSNLSVAGKRTELSIDPYFLDGFP